MNDRRCSKGITLIELLVVIAIIGVLAAIAVVSFTSYLQRGRRADAKTALEQIRAAQEMRRAERGSYSTSLVELQTTWGVPANPVGDYNLSFVAADANSFTAQAEPFTSRQQDDKWLRINHLGQKWDYNNNYYPEGKWAK